MQIHKVTRAVHEFLAEMFIGETKVMSINKVGAEQWKAICEVYEESSFIKSIGIKSKVMDRNIYEIMLDNSLDVISYVRTDSDIA